jgi:hypothetical protein
MERGLREQRQRVGPLLRHLRALRKRFRGNVLHISRCTLVAASPSRPHGGYPCPQLGGSIAGRGLAHLVQRLDHGLQDGEEVPEVVGIEVERILHFVVVRESLEDVRERRRLAGHRDAGHALAVVLDLLAKRREQRP